MMDEMNNHIPDENNQNLESQENEVLEDTNESEIVVESSTPVSPAPQKSNSKKLIIGGLIAIAVIGVILAVILGGLGGKQNDNLPSSTTTTTTTTTTTMPPHVHTEVFDKAVAPTCTSTGLTEGKHCSECGEVIVAQQTIAATGEHNYVNNVCSVCGAVKVIDIPNDVVINGDNEELANEVIEEIQTNEALAGLVIENLPENGSLEIAVSEININENALTELVFVVSPMDADGNKVETFEAGKGITFRLPIPSSVTESYAIVYHEDAIHGVYEIKTLGGDKYIEVYSENFSEYGVVLHNHEYESTVTAPTCTTSGYTTYTCACGDTYIADEVGVLGHTFVDGVCSVCGAEDPDYVAPHEHEYISVVTAPTCTTKGYTTYTCACGETYISDEVDSLGHDYDAVVTTPDCVNGGYTTYTCTVCNHSYIADEVAALGHTEVVDQAVTPTCTTTGLTEGKHCSVCNEILVAQEVVAALGHTEAIDNAVAPTCTTTGLTEGKHCSVCNTVILVQIEVPVIAHTYDDQYDANCNVCGYERDADCAHSEIEIIEGYESTCISAGLTDGEKCKTCGEILIAQTVINALGHTEVIDNAIAPTCTTTGLTEGKHCSVCNEVIVKQETVDALGHTEVVDKAVAPTCTTTGLTEGKHCSVCNEVLVAQEVVAALGHTEVVDKAVAPTCEATGLTEGKHCSVCNEVLVKQETVDALGHIYIDGMCKCGAEDPNYVAPHEHEYTSVVTAPTCTTKGYTTYTCACGETYISDEVDALGHTEAIDNAVAPTCTTTGLTEGKHCSVCNTVILVQIEVPVIAHTYDDQYDANCNVCGYERDADCAHSEIEIIEGYESTCISAGLTDGEQCKTCGEILVAQTVINALGHTEVVDKAVAPTCTTTGLTEGKHCSVCNEVIVKQETVDALGHTEVVDKAVAPTCEATGLTEGKHCSVCNEVLVVQEVVAAFGHIYIDGMCKCGAEDPNYVAPHVHEYESTVTAPTCTTGGYTTYTCACGDKYTSDETDALGHDYEAVVTAPDCVNGGYTTYTCTVCNHSYIADEVSALGHTEVVDKAVAPTCTTTGLTEGKHCSVCNEVLVVQEVVAAFGHTEAIDNAVAPTCTTTGLTEGKHCSVCNTVILVQIEVPVIAHTYDDQYDANCNVCGYERDADCAHSEIEIIEGYESTCISAGLTDGEQCKTCGEILVAQTVINALGHTEVVDKAVAPTCTTTGLTEGKHCSVCNEVIVKQETVDALGHTEVVDKAVAPTCTTTGLTEGKHCSVCNEVLVAQEVVAALGHTEVVDKAVAPTCEATGLTEGKHCSVCNEVLVKQETVDALGHIYIDGMCKCGAEDPDYVAPHVHEYELTVTAPTCTTGGYTTYTCACGETYISDEVDSLGHDYDAVVTAPDCVNDGYTTYTCTVCGDTYVDDETSALGHTEVVDEAVAPTCTSTGLTEGKHCSVCNEVLVAQEVIDALGHTEVVDKAVAPTCTTTGLTEGKHCSVCNEVLVKQETVDALGHTNSDVVVENNVAPDCVNNGSYDNVVYCTVCGEELSRETVVVDALGHDYDAVVTAPDCVNGGYTTYTCTVCNHSYVADEVAALGHTNSDVVVENNVAPDCVNNGSYDNVVYCTVCGEELSRETVVVDALGHDYDAVVTTPDCVNGGYTTYTCTVCNHSYIADEVAALGHTEVVDQAVTPTCTTTGLTEGKHCSVCNEILVAQEIMPMIDCIETDWIVDKEATKLEDGLRHTVCTMCGEIITEEILPATGSLGLIYRLNSDGESYSVTGIGTCTDTDIVIPARYNGLPVTSIGDYAFQYCTSLTSVVIGDSVTSMGSYAFSSCTSLTSVVIPDSVTSIGYAVFYGATAIKSIEVDSNNQYYQSIDGNLYTKDGTVLMQYSAGKEATSFVIPDSVTHISDFAFYGSYSLTSVEIGNSVESIGDYAFYYCRFITSIEIPDSVQSIGKWAFNYCSALTSVFIPDSVTSIGERAFFTATSLTIYCEATSKPSGWDKNWNPDNRPVVWGTDHIHIEVIDEAVAPTCTEAGLTEGSHCSVCNEVLVAQETIPMIDCIESDWIVDKVATKTEDGKRHTVCTMCGEIITEEILPAIGSLGLEYTLNSNGESYSVTGIGTCTDIHVVIPGIYNGLPVTSIGDYAFRDCKCLKSIYIPDTVISINYAAFQDCDSLLDIGIPDSVTSIGNYAFDGCSSLTSIVIPDSVTSISSGAFYGCSNLTSIEIPDSVTSIGNYAFYGCTWLASVVIGDSVTSIGDSAFGCCESLTSIEISDSVTSIGSAFHNCTSLTSVVIGDSVTSIGDSAFLGCTSLTSIVIPNSVTSIGDSAFEYCTSLTIYCEATSKPSGWDNNWNPDNRPVVWGTDHIHIEVIDEAVAPTCTEAGLTEGSHCSVCNRVLLEQEVVDALGHQKCVIIPPQTLYTTTNSDTYPFTISGNQITSTNKANSSSSTYTIVANQTFNLELQYKVSSEAFYDKLIIKHNSTTKVTISGTSSTTFTTLNISMMAGDTVTITYSKDGSSSDGTDCAYVKIITANETIGESRTELVRITSSNLSSLASCLEDVLCYTCGEVAIEKIEHTYSNNICSICGDNKRDFAGGIGTESSPYLISTVQHLNNVRLYPSAHFELINDIQFTSQDYYYSGSFYNSGCYWNPIDDFTGNFNGNNYSIDGLKINRSGGGKQINGVWYSTDYFGLFSSTEGEISNLTLSNTNIEIYVSYSGTSNSNTTGGVYVGGIAGRSNGKIFNCTVSGKITVTGQTNNVRALVGGIVGYTYTDCSIENCVNHATISATCTKTVYNYGSGTYISTSFVTVGGIVGEFQGTDVANCSNYGTVTATSCVDPYAGGIVGECTRHTIDGKTDIQVRNCYNYGNVLANSTPPSKIEKDHNSSYSYLKSTAGGIVGYMVETEIVNCGNYADVTAKGWNASAGGVIGYVYYRKSFVTQCFNIGNVLSYDTDTSSRWYYGNHNAGGITGNGGTIDQCYNTGTVTATGKDYVSSAGITTCTFEKISNCYNTGTISANLDAYDSKAAGIIVDCPTAIEYCYNIGDLVGTKKAGIVCTLYDGTTNYDTERHVLYCYYLNSVSVGVYETFDYCTKLTYAKTDSQLKNQSTFNNFDFDNIWTIADGENPYPQLKNNLQITD